MTTVTAAQAYWDAVLAASGETNRADAIAALLASGSKIKFYDASGALIRTVTMAAAARGSAEDDMYPINLGAFNSSQTGTGTPALAVFTTSADVEIFRCTAGVASGLLQIPSAFVSGVDLVPGALRGLARAPVSAPSGKKWHPGHYYYVSQDWTHDVTMVESRRNKVKNNPYFAGYKLLAYWDKMESTQGTYDFSDVLTELDKAEADGKKVNLQIEERSFHGSARGLPCPQYVYDGGGTYASQTNGENILAPKFWVPWVGEAFFEMLVALIEATDDHPALALYTTEECSIAGAWLQSGWTWQAMNAFILDYCRIGSSTAQQTPWHQNMGWSNEPSSNTAEHYRMTDAVVRTYKAGLGPTDLRLSTATATLNTTYGSYCYTRYAGEAVFATCCEYNSYILPEGPKQLLDFAVDTLGAHFICWASTDYSASWSFTDDDVIAEVTRQQGRVNTDRPANVPGVL